ncbi:heparan-alpha-glucosaminide N-acetyltransferase isoform X1 [Selaginella moellendorffii]|uniref:heparan-alpha-glucosaminide N-acetyltransferase isoform X1 n=2 Tax=Selaginella moellendorffii TaxID=88036 RepID=UPI000D1C7117|nr:heparan-alpha-glucosaminide N-acetyltransferase isoform X1 [Selaginella moellendorffii]|eukprot:XP_024544892.1 heparan-alpha-glucosaminide N-acetyltransferase isoform X1 [Selaginella moellendorffii]
MATSYGCGFQATAVLNRALLWGAMAEQGEVHEKLEGHDTKEHKISFHEEDHHVKKESLLNGDQAVAVPLKKPVRIATLDVFRGLTVALMVLVDDAGGEWPRINHSPWNGCTLADLVMPFFLFIVGVAIALALKRIPDQVAATQKVVIRTLKLLFWGLLLQGGFSHAPDDLSYGVDMRKIRWCGILQRIAFGYLIVALVEIATTKSRSLELPKGHFGIFKLYKWHWACALAVVIIYHSVAYGLYVPDWHFIDSGHRFVVQCGVRGDIGPACNAVGHIDRTILGINHLYQSPEWTRTQSCDLDSPAEGDPPANAPAWCKAPFEPEGILSSISAILSCIIGIHYGHVLIHFKGHMKRVLHWTIPAAALLVLATILHFTHAIPLNKQLYSFSYVCFTAGAAGMIFSLLYVVIDIFGINQPTLIFQWMGLNAMFVFVMAASGIAAAFVNGWYWHDPSNNLVNWIKKHVFVNVWHSQRVGTLLYVLIAEILFWGLVSGILHWRGIYWKL